MPGTEDKRARARQKAVGHRAAPSPARGPKSEAGEGAPQPAEGRRFDWRRYAESRLHDHAHR